MGNRFVISGVQLGMLIAMPSLHDRQKKADEIIKNQWLEDSDEPLSTDIKLYKKMMAEIQGDTK